MGDRGPRVRATCHACGHTPWVPAELAGKKIRCPKCDEKVRVPEDLSGSDTNPIVPKARAARDETSGRDRARARDETSGRDRARARDETSGRDRARARDETSGRDRARARDETSGRDRARRREPKPESPPPPPSVSSVEVVTPRNPAWTYRVWLLVLLLIPLVVSIAGTSRDGSDKELAERLDRTLSHETPEVQFRIQRLRETDGTTMDDLLGALPEAKLDGALFARDTFAHWGIAFAAGIAFLALTPLLFPRGSESRFELLTIAFYTATAGVLLLLGLQRFAFASLRWRGGGILLFLVHLIAHSYALANGPDDNVITSMIGFTCGVGLCEEVTKALPLILHVAKKRELEWRKACLWGLASGIGFGVAEGVMYSGRSYNGIDGPGIYAVRFLSCVGLHGLWAAAGCISISLDQKRIAGATSLKVLFLCVVRALAARIILHGFYDTLLKKDSYLLALFCAIGSFGWLVSEIDRAYKVETKALLAT